MGKTIVFGKLGRTIRFNRKNWKSGAGNNEPATLLSALANANPQNKYIVIGRSDFSRCDEETLKYWFKHDNVEDAWVDYDKKKHDLYNFLYEKYKDTHIDYGIINGGITGNTNSPGCFIKYDKDGNSTGEKLRVLDAMAFYVGPIICLLNKRKIKWVNFHADARQFPIKGKDVFQQPELTIGTRNIDRVKMTYKDYDDQTDTPREMSMRYGMTEALLLLDPEYKDFPKVEKDIKVGFFFHNYEKIKNRTQELLNYIDQFGEDEISVYGKWKGFEDQPKFKGECTFDEMQEILPRIKYTLCYPIVKGDISAKWIEAVRAGIIPFFDEKYDENRLLVDIHNVPSFLYVSSPEDMKEKIDTLEKDPHVYKSILDLLTDRLEYLKENILSIYECEIEDAIEGGIEKYDKNY
nr:Glycosyltransferase [Enterococcus phage Planchet]